MEKKKEIRIVALDKNYRTSDEAVGMVYQSYDYDKFMTFESNREPDHYPQIAKSMVERGAIMTPIKVTTHATCPGKLIIIDGNNSFHARKELGLPIPYIVFKDATDEDMITLNIVTKNWSVKDYVNYFASKNFKEYVIFKSILEEHPFNCKSVERILRISNTQDGSYKRSGNSCSIKCGKFVCKDLPKSMEIIKFLYGVKECCHAQCGKIYNDDLFVAAIVTLWRNKDFDPNAFLIKLNGKAGAIISPQRDTEYYLNMIDNIYNYQVKKNRVNLLANGKD